MIVFLPYIIMQAIVFPVRLHESKSLILKKQDSKSIDPFELWCARKLLRIMSIAIAIAFI